MTEHTAHQKIALVTGADVCHEGRGGRDVTDGRGCLV